MKLGIVQMAIAVIIIVLAMLTQLVPSLVSGRGNGRPDPNGPTLGAYSRALAQDDNEDGDNDDDNEDGDNDDDNEDEDNEDDNEDGDNQDDDADNDDEDADNEDDDDNENQDNEDDEDFDNEEDDAENGEDDNSDPVVDGASFTFDASVREAMGTTTGGDDRIGLPADRVLVQTFPWMPPGVSLTIRLADPAVATTSCRLVGDLVFQIEGYDDTGTALTQLPAEVNLSARYTDRQVSGLSRQAATLLWLDPADSQWKPAPKLVTNPSTNYVAASVTALGSYAVCAT